jgi:DNA-binding NtrC family response regulator
MVSKDFSAVAMFPGETLEASPNTSISVQQFRVEVIRGGDVGREATSHGEALVIGKAEGAQLLLQDPLVSRFHLELRPTPSGVVVRDLGSKNGSFLGKTAFHEILIREDTTLLLGKTAVRVEMHGVGGNLELSSQPAFGALVGDSQAMRRAFHLLKRAAAVRSPVLLRGEVGTGKQEAARSLHAVGATGGELVIFDCAAVPGPLVDQELFADDGALAAARGGTLFFHEVGDLPPATQGRLVRVLESAAARDIRFVSASSQDLQAQVNRREFRPELYYRLAAVTISLPPLRERREDIPALVGQMLHEIQQAEGLTLPLAQQRELIEDAQTRAWPGNLRELRAFVEHLVVLGDSGESAPRAPGPGPDINAAAPLREERDRWNKQLESRYLALLLEKTGWNIVVAARSAGVGREYLHRLIKSHGLQRPR